MISQRAKYALRALVMLARAEPGKALAIPDIAREQAIPKKFLEQILLQLNRNGLVYSRRGKVGGYMLLKPAEQITYGEVLRIIDGPVALLPCLSRIAYRRCEDCSDEATCEIRKVFGKVAEATRAVLDETSIAEEISPSVVS
ncbi:MAG TPA: Rrf2 family transcriptional regulator [Rhizobiaceae bacterium]|nr:Rrf2 family transcriptional regulator [Rhizobiaceae bacterium]